MFNLNVLRFSECSFSFTQQFFKRFSRGEKKGTSAKPLQHFLLKTQKIFTGDSISKEVSFYFEPLFIARHARTKGLTNFEHRFSDFKIFKSYLKLFDLNRSEQLASN